jgi:hypothetical protein
MNTKRPKTQRNPKPLHRAGADCPAIRAQFDAIRHQSTTAATFAAAEAVLRDATDALVKAAAAREQARQAAQSAHYQLNQLEACLENGGTF